MYRRHQAIVGGEFYIRPIGKGRIQDSPLRNKPNWPKRRSMRYILSGSTGLCGHVFLGIYELKMNLGVVPEKLLKTFQSFRSLKILGLSHNKHCAHWQNHKIR